MITNIYKRFFQSEPDMYSLNEIEEFNVNELLHALSEQRIDKHNFSYFISQRLPCFDMKNKHVLLIDDTKVRCWDIIQKAFVLHYNIDNAFGILDNQSEHVLITNPQSCKVIRINIETNHLKNIELSKSPTCLCTSPIDENLLYVAHEDNSISLVKIDTCHVENSIFQVDFHIHSMHIEKHVLLIISKDFTYARKTKPI